MTFDEATWKSEAAYDEPFPRRRMFDDLVRRIPPGTPRARVIEMLGEPADTTKFADRGLVYWLGDERSLMSVDSEWAVIDFDDDGGLLRLERVTD